MDRVHSVARGDGLHVIPTPLPAVTLVVVRPGETSLEVLLLRRPQHMRFAAGVWVFPGGRIDEGESLVDAAVRETHEETALKIPASECSPLDWWVTPETEVRRFDVQFLIAPAPVGQSPSRNPDEVDELRWIAPADAIAEGLPMLRPTIAVLTHLAEKGSLAEAIPEPGTIVPRMPRPFLVEDGIVWNIINAETEEVLQANVPKPRWEANP